MLILQRKPGESVVIGEEISITVVSVEGGRVRLAISAPQEIPILRSELLAATAVNRDSAAEEAAPTELLGLLGGISNSNSNPNSNPNSNLERKPPDEKA